MNVAAFWAALSDDEDNEECDESLSCIGFQNEVIPPHLGRLGEEYAKGWLSQQLALEGISPVNVVWLNKDGDSIPSH